MDMNWQAMLHEAADASFEKNIESLAAADNDACSYADLPKAKIQELSEKILYLPHQGIVLLFSRYCFRLSPKEAEKFFQLENAKGRFRFYRELLSSNMGFSSAQVISDDSLNQACRIAMKTYLRMELKEDPAANSAGKRRTHIAFRRFGKAVAVAAITITLLFSTAMVANAQFREKVIAWVVETFEKYSSFELQSDRENAQTGLQNYSGGFEILLSKSDTKVYLNTENTEITPFDQNEIAGYYFKKGDLNYVCCDRDGYFIAIYGSIDTDELIKIAAGITRK